MSFKYKSNGTIGFGNILESILKNKGINNIPQFLNPTEQCLEDESLFDNIDRGKELLLKHIENKDKILIIVDCDVDGYTSAALIYQYLIETFKYINIEFIVHDGKQHGLSDIINEVIESKCKLVIVPDAGTNDIIPIKKLKKKDINIIILDHHKCSKDEPYSPEYHAVIINNQMSKSIKDKAMTGVGIVYKFCKYLDKQLGFNNTDKYLDLVTLGMIADTCDLRNIQSRYLVLQGIKLIDTKNNKNKFISKLIESQSFSLKDKVTIMGIAFYIAPLINSLIRIGSYEDKKYMFEAFINSDKKLMRNIKGKGEVLLSIQDYIIKSCESSKRKQQKETIENVELLDKQINNFKLNEKAIIICNANDSVSKNFTGLIANKIASNYQKPCLILRLNEKLKLILKPKNKELKLQKISKINKISNRIKVKYCGSGRGVENSSINNLLQWCKDTNLFIFSEGHDNAFGCGITLHNINKLYEVISKIEYINELIYNVDGIFNEKSLNSNIIEMVTKHSNVWGTTVKEPIFAIENITIKKEDINLLGAKQNTIKFTYHNIEFIKFNVDTEIYNSIIKTGDNIKFTIIGRFSINEYGGNKTTQVLIDDMMYELSDIKQGFRF